jgi:hypothetical protein
MKILACFAYVCGASLTGFLFTLLAPALPIDSFTSAVNAWLTSLVGVVIFCWIPIVVYALTPRRYFMLATLGSSIAVLLTIVLVVWRIDPYCRDLAVWEPMCATSLINKYLNAKEIGSLLSMHAVGSVCWFLIGSMGWSRSEPA